MSAITSIPTHRPAETPDRSKRNREVDVERMHDISAPPAIGQIFLLRSADPNLEGCLGVLLDKDSESGLGFFHPLYTPPYDGIIDVADEDVVVDGDALKLPYVTNAIVRPSIRAEVPLAALTEAVGDVSIAKCSELKREQKNEARDARRQQSLLHAWESKVSSLVRSQLSR